MHPIYGLSTVVLCVLTGSSVGLGNYAIASYLALFTIVLCFHGLADTIRSK